MSDLRIRSEAIPEPLWPEDFLPPRAVLDTVPVEDDFSALLASADIVLSRLFGAAVKVLPGRTDSSAPALRVCRELAALLMTLRLGGDPARSVAGPAVPAPAGVALALPASGGVALTRHGGAIAAALDAVAAEHWPSSCRLPGLDLVIACCGVSGTAHVAAPPMAAIAPPAPVAALALRLFEMPMRVRIELASEAVLVSSLLPLHAGTVVPISPSPEMPLLLGDHRIGRATLAPMPDGRQQATIIAIGVEALGGRQ